MRRNHNLAIVLLIAFSLACASVGTSDPALVKAEDFLSNSLSVYDAAMAYHFAQSTRETPEVYATFERVRTGFPIAWKALFDGSVEYRKNPDAPKLDRLLNAAQTLLNAVAPLIPQTR